MKSNRYNSPGHVARILRQLWREAQRDYNDAGRPLGPSKRALDLWIMYETRTTCN